MYVSKFIRFKNKSLLIGYNFFFLLTNGWSGAVQFDGIGEARATSAQVGLAAGLATATRYPNHAWIFMVISTRQKLMEKYHAIFIFILNYILQFNFFKH